MRTGGRAGGQVRARSKRKRARRLKWALWIGTATLLGLTIISGVYVWSVFNALEPRVAQLARIEADLERIPTEIVSADGVVLCRLAAEHREPVEYPEIPKVVLDATVAAEDKRFWRHGGVDLTAILRALWVNLRSGTVRQGGSTITQQVAKRLLTSGERTMRRKVEDACLALQIERQLTKAQIITLYLNQVFYGSGAYGIKAAADVYFGKDLKELTLGEAAMLARLPRRPSEDNPYVNPDAARANRNTVLEIMLEEGTISQAEYDEAVMEPLKLAAHKPVQQIGIRHAPYFTTYVLEQMRREFPNEDFARGGYKIYTTLNMDAQRAAYEAVRKTLKTYRKRRVTEGAIVVTALNGEIVAMIGGSNFKRSQYNVISQGRRQPGSAFKPFVYSAAIELGHLKPTSQVSNQKFVLPDDRRGKAWIPKGGGQGGTVSVQAAIVRSINVPAVHVCNMVGPSVAAAFARDVFGFESRLDPVLSLVLGTSAVRPVEMAEAYSVFATGGHRVKAYGIRRVVGPGGMVLREFVPKIVPNVLSSSTVEPMHDILRRVVTSGTGRAARSVANAAGKTGTTDAHRDAWFCGYTDRLIAVAWVANATYDPNRNPAWHYGEMAGVFGGEVATRMWADCLKPIQKLIGEKPIGYKARSYDGDEQTAFSVLICVDTGERAIRNRCPRTETRTFGREEARTLPACSLHSVLPDEPPPEEREPGPEEPPPSAPPPEPPSAAATTVVTVEVCVESGLRATTYCRVKRKQTFERGSEPSETCRAHQP